MGKVSNEIILLIPFSNSILFPQIYRCQLFNLEIKRIIASVFKVIHYVCVTLINKIKKKGGRNETKNSLFIFVLVTGNSFITK